MLQQGKAKQRKYFFAALKKEGSLPYKQPITTLQGNDRETLVHQTMTCLLQHLCAHCRDDPSVILSRGEVLDKRRYWQRLYW